MRIVFQQTHLSDHACANQLNGIGAAEVEVAFFDEIAWFDACSVQAGFTLLLIVGTPDNSADFHHPDFRGDGRTLFTAKPFASVDAGKLA